jgi:hypothetical protein
MFKQYNDYLKDNPRGLWFKAKLYGWGWVPAKWQGWVVLAIFVFFISWMVSAQAALVDKGIQPSSTDLVWFFGKLALVLVLLIAVCYWKGEKPRWQWGQRRSPNSADSQNPPKKY